MVGAEQVLVISPETDHHKKIDAAICKCGLNSYCCEKFDEANLPGQTEIQRGVLP